MVCYTLPAGIAPEATGNTSNDHSANVRWQAQRKQLLAFPFAQPAVSNPEFFPAWQAVDSSVCAGVYGLAAPNFLPCTPSYDPSAIGPAMTAGAFTGWVFMHVPTDDGTAQQAQALGAGACDVPVEQVGVGDLLQHPIPEWILASPETTDGETSGEAKGSSWTVAFGRPTASALRRRRRQQAAAFARQQRDAEFDDCQSVTQDTHAALGGRSVVQTNVVAVPADGSFVDNFWRVKLMKQLEAGGEETRAAVAELRGCARRLTFEAIGCRVLQMALRIAEQRDAASLAAELHGCVWRAISSPHGNFVMQAVVETMPTALASFVAEELKGKGAETSRHKYGCRIMCRLLEHSVGESATVVLIDETLQEAEGLCRHGFGHHVMESVLEHGLPAQQQRVVAALLAELPRNAEDNSATHVIVAAFRHCSRSEQAKLAAALLSSADGLFHLAGHRYGIHVVRALLRLPGEAAQIARRILEQDIARLQKSSYGNRLAEELH